MRDAILSLARYALWLPFVVPVAWWYIEANRTIISHAPDKKPELVYSDPISPPAVIYIRWWLKKHHYCRGVATLIATRVDRPWTRHVLDSHPATLLPEEASGDKDFEYSYQVGVTLAPIAGNPRDEICYHTTLHHDYDCNWLFRSPISRIQGPQFCVMKK